MNVLSFFRSRNECLKRFRDLSISFSQNSDTSAINDRIEELEVEREQLLKAALLFERKISDEIVRLGKDAFSQESIEEMRSFERARQDLLTEIIRADKGVEDMIERFCTDIEKDLTTSRKNQENLQKFKSYWVQPTGEEIDRSL